MISKILNSSYLLFFINIKFNNLQIGYIGHFQIFDDRK